MSEICCVCLQKSVFYQNITECVFGTVKYTEKLNICVPNALWDDAFNICNDCVDKLDSAYGFVELCLKSQGWRQEQLTVVELKCEVLINPKEVSTEFTCHQCRKSFRLKRSLSNHITRMHTRPKRNISRRSLVVKSGSDSGSEIKKEKNLFDNSGDGKKKLDVKDESIVKVENERENSMEIKETISDSEDIGEDNNCLSPVEREEEEKPYKAKKRGYKCKGPFQCDFCELVFKRTHKLIHHVRAKHTFEKPFKCNMCDAKYLSQSYLSVHKRKHTNEKPYVCSTCGKSFISTNDLWRHNKIHESVRQYPCNECERRFKTNSNLRTHKLQMHQDPGTWKFICTVCGKRFPLNTTLVKHMRRHEGVKPFLCHLCHKRFIEKIELHNHLVSHSDERNFKCNICDKAYKKCDNLSRHLKRDHDIGSRVVKKPEKKLNCPMCPKMFEFNNKLQRHILTHTGEKPVPCEYCDKRFRDNYDRSIHVGKDHNIESKNLMSSL